MVTSEFLSKLYHTKNYQGTITQEQIDANAAALYHTKNYQGTITYMPSFANLGELYHTKNYQGTITGIQLHCSTTCIIPYQELSGNYNP